MLAIALGLTPVYVNRILQEFRREQLITLEQRRLTLLDVEKLQGISGLTPDYLRPGTTPSGLMHYFDPAGILPQGFDRRGGNPLCLDAIPADLDVVRYWDLAATEKTEFNDPDWTVGIKLGRDQSGGYWLMDMVRARANPGDVERLLLNTAEQDGKKVCIGFGQDPGQAGKSQALHLVRSLSAFTVRPAPESGDKLTRFGPFSSQCRAGNVKVLRRAWNEELLRVLEGFPDVAHDDEVHACSGALEMLNPQMTSRGLYEFYRQEAERLRAEKEGT